MADLSVYVQVSAFIAALFIFTLFSFMHTPSTGLVIKFRLVLANGLLWIIAKLFMYAHIRPSVLFWHNVSMIGFFCIPIPVYYFLFSALKIKRTKALMIYAAVTDAFVILNCINGFLMNTPEEVINENGDITFIYHAGVGTWILVIFGTLMSIHTFANCYGVIKHSKSDFKSYLLVEISMLAVIVGGFIEIIGNTSFPYAILFAGLLAIALYYVMSMLYRFDIKYQILSGLVYSALLAVVLALALWGSHAIFNLIEDGTDNEATVFARVIGAIGVVCSIETLMVNTWLRRLQRKRENRREQIVENFRSELVSLIGRDEFYFKIRSTILEISPYTTTAIFIKDSETGEFKGADYRDNENLSEEFKNEIVKNINYPAYLSENDVFVIKSDNEVLGFFRVEANRGRKLEYSETKAFKQIGEYVALYQKNSNVYETVYQMSIRDDSTGLYNKVYLSEYARINAIGEKPHSVMVVNVDNFRLYEALYGSAVSELIPKWIGENIKDTVGRRGKAFKTGTDEYLIDTEMVDHEELKAFAKEIMDSLNRNSPERPAIKEPITLSIGISVDDKAVFDFNGLMAAAREACYFAKRRGKNNTMFYSEGLTENAMREDFAHIEPIVEALMSAIDLKDAYTYKHSKNVSRYAVIVGEALGISGSELAILKEAGMLHDVGKLNIKMEILQKPGSLNYEENKMMQSHVREGIEIIHYLPNMQYILPAVASHHERYDGNGYPRGLKGEEIPYFGRILALCDSFDAMTSTRPYRMALSVEAALEEIEKNKGTQFDPEIADVFIKLFKDKGMTI